jgi:hypothetical protein
MSKLCLTHSTRKMDFDQCDLNFLVNRYKRKGRLINPPPLETLANEFTATYTGSFSVWDWPDPMRSPTLIRWAAKDYKVQHARLRSEELILAGTAFIEVYHSVFDDVPRQIITNNLLAGNHLFEVTQDGGLIISCSASDAILYFNADGRLVEFFRVPEEVYGSNYQFPLAGDISLRDHYIHNDLQLTHINSVHQYKGGFLVSTLIQGDIGFFDKNKNYRIITSGFVGAHGVKSMANGDIYFCDSCTGCINVVDFFGRLKRRYKVNSVWLQDAMHINQEIFLCAVSDRNSFELWDFSKNNVVWKIDGADFGETTQFIGLEDAFT